MNHEERSINLETAAKVAAALGYELKRSVETTAGAGLAISLGSEMLASHVDNNILPLAVLGASPIPAFSTNMKTGTFQFINAAFAKLFNFETPEDMLQAHATAKDLYRDVNDRTRWVSFMNDSTKGGFQYSPAYILDLVNRSTRTRVSVAAVAKVIDYDEKRYALGLAIDVTQHQIKSEKRANLLDAFSMLLNDPNCNLGLHTLILESAEIFVDQMNLHARQVLGLNDKWWTQIRSIADFDGNPKAIEETGSKLMGQTELRVNQYCTFTDHRNPDAQRTTPAKRTVPVIVNEYGVRDPSAAIGADAMHSRRFCGIVTSIRDARIPDDIVKLLQTYGPRNPMLEDADVQTIVKGCVSSKDGEMQFEFRFANLPMKQELVRRRKLKVRYCHPDEHDVKFDADDIESVDGKTEEQLFGQYGHRYKQTDEVVYRDNVIVQQIEDHPILGTSEALGELQMKTEVHVIKIPHKDAFGKIHGVEVFFWEISKEADVFQKLRTAYRPWNYLDDIPVPVYRKDRKLRFIYCNSAFVDDIKMISRSITSVRDIIGLADWQIHEESLARQYEDDDRNLLEDRTPIQRVERHGDYWVKVVKTAIVSTSDDKGFTREGRADVIAIQGIFWKLDLEEMREFVEGRR